MRLLTDCSFFPSALDQTDGIGRRSSLARVASADLVHTNGFGLALLPRRAAIALQGSFGSRGRSLGRPSEIAAKPAGRERGELGGGSG
jgi:hypothetical protein